MTTELYWLVLTVLMTALFWVPYVLDRLAVRGLWPTLASPKPESGEQHSLWAQRAIKAHQNAVENLAIFVPAVLVAHLLGVSTPATRLAAAAYFFARLVHFLVYTAGVPVLRTLAFAVGWVCQLVILAGILGWM
ncbi:MAG: MAPEG family protein [Alphaproteobacteria bacterium]|nr:MAPEG family protein [Alphaproteobacteria bacterium]